MNFIDVGFKHYCIGDGVCSYIKTVFYAVDDFDREVNLYEWINFYMNEKTNETERVLKHLNEDEINDLNDIINYKKENCLDNTDYDFIENLKTEKRVLVKKYE